MTIFNELQTALSSVRAKTDFSPKIGLVLGSGLGGFADNIDVASRVSYSDIENFPLSTVPGHAGEYIFGTLSGVPVVCMKGRVHYYEGYPMRKVVMPVRLMRLMGAETLFLTNAAGGINERFYAGALMLITGQISSFVPSPLIGGNEDELGLRFPDMTRVYDPELSAIIENTAIENNIDLKKGVYVQLGGPNFETPEEIRMLKSLGADAVGMSSACEAIAGRHMGMRICGVSCISNLAAGITGNPLTHEEVMEAADKAAPRFTKLLVESIAKM